MTYLKRLLFPLDGNFVYHRGSNYTKVNTTKIGYFIRFTHENTSTSGWRRKLQVLLQTLYPEMMHLFTLEISQFYKKKTIVI